MTNLSGPNQHAASHDAGGYDPITFPAAALTSLAGELGGTYSVTGSMATFLTTASLAVGTWLVTFKGTGSTGGSIGNGINVQAIVGTATATLVGSRADGIQNPSSAGGALIGDLVMNFVATVTAPGTLVFQGTGPAGTIEAGGNTSYTAVKIA